MASSTSPLSDTSHTSRPGPLASRYSKPPSSFVKSLNSKIPPYSSSLSNPPSSGFSSSSSSRYVPFSHSSPDYKSSTSRPISSKPSAFSSTSSSYDSHPNEYEDQGYADDDYGYYPDEQPRDDYYDAPPPRMSRYSQHNQYDPSSRSYSHAKKHHRHSGDLVNQSVIDSSDDGVGGGSATPLSWMQSHKWIIGIVVFIICLGLLFFAYRWYTKRRESQKLMVSNADGSTEQEANGEDPRSMKMIPGSIGSSSPDVSLNASYVEQMQRLMEKNQELEQKQAVQNQQMQELMKLHKSTLDQIKSKSLGMKSPKVHSPLDMKYESLQTRSNNMNNSGAAVNSSMGSIHPNVIGTATFSSFAPLPVETSYTSSKKR